MNFKIYCTIEALTLLLLVLISPVGYCFEYDTVWSLYQQAVKKDPLIKAAEARLKASHQEKPLARSQLMPHLQAEIGQGYYAKNITGMGPEGIKKDYWGDNYGVRLVQPIFNGQACVSLKMAKSIISAQKAQYIFAKQELIKRLSIAYLDLLDAKSALQVARDRVKLDERILERAKTFLRVGTGDIVSVKEAEARLDAAKAGVINAKNLVSIKKSDLSIVAHTNVNEILDIREFTPRLPDPNNPDAWIKAALDNRPILKEAGHKLVLANQKIEHARRARWPRVDFEAAASYANGLFLPDVIYREAHGVFKLTFPFYLGGAITANTRKAQQEALAAEHNLRHLEDVVTLETKSAYLTLKDSVALIDAASKALESARVSMEATTKGYEVGTRNIIDVLDITDKYLVRRQQYLHSLYNHLKARILLKKATGTLGEADLKALEGLLMRNTGRKDPGNG